MKDLTLLLPPVVSLALHALEKPRDSHDPLQAVICRKRKLWMEKTGFGAALLQCQNFKSLFQSGTPSPNFPVSLFLYL